MISLLESIQSTYKSHFTPISRDIVVEVWKVYITEKRTLVEIFIPELGLSINQSGRMNMMYDTQIRHSNKLSSILSNHKAPVLSNRILLQEEEATFIRNFVEKKHVVQLTEIKIKDVFNRIMASM
jgi:hypothetical protein